MLLDGRHHHLERPPARTHVMKRRVGNLGEDQLFAPRASLVEASAGLASLPLVPSIGPMEPSVSTGHILQHHRERAEARPVAAGRDVSLLHAVRKDVSNPAQQRFVIEYGLRGVAPLPESATPPDDGTDLLREVRQQVVHELRDVAARCPNEEVKVVRGEHEGEELDSRESHRTGQHPADDFVRPFRRTEEETPLQTTDRQEVRNSRLVHPEWSPQLNSPL